MMLNTKHIKLNIQYDLEELREYYWTLERDYQYRKWIALEQREHIMPTRFGTDINRASSGWSIQTYMPPESNVIPAPWNVVTEDITDGRTETELLFGIARRFVEKIPMCIRLGISVTPETHCILPHTDAHWHIHMPIYSPINSIFRYDDLNEPDVHYPEGETWALNTMWNHSVYNNGPGNRVHMFFSVWEYDMLDLIEWTKDGITI